jgi:hypothetical protein
MPYLEYEIEICFKKKEKKRPKSINVNYQNLQSKIVNKKNV